MLKSQLPRILFIQFFIIFQYPLKFINFVFSHSANRFFGWLISINSTYFACSLTFMK